VYVREGNHFERSGGSGEGGNILKFFTARLALWSVV
jgi:hypothetical protein